MFDTKGKNHGGNGAKFNWKMLEKYTHQKPFILSGGIDENDVNEIKNLAQKIPWLQTVDINSCFEEKPGYKNPEKIQKFINDFKNLA